MTILLEELQKEQASLLRQIRKLEKILPDYPEGTLNFSTCRGKTRYYHYRHKEDSSSGTLNYIAKENINLAEKLAQKDYDMDLYKCLKKRLSQVINLIKTYQNNAPTDLYQNLNPTRKLLVTPRCQTDEELIARWQSVEYEKKGFGANAKEYYTRKKERVRSKSEIIIADTLDDHGIPYRYEYPVQVCTGDFLHPDFTVLNKRTLKEYYWEHFGMMDDPSYVAAQMSRINVLEYSGIFPGKNLIITHESENQPLDRKLLDMIIEKYLL